MFTSFCIPALPISDDFNAADLDTDLWSVVDPVGDGQVTVVGAATPDAQLRLMVPAGSNHDVWTAGNRSLRVMQAAPDEDFEIEVKFESAPSQRFQLQGVLIEQNETDFIRFDFYSNGNELYMFGAYFIPGSSPQVLVNQAITEADDALYLRVTREADLWTAQYGYDAEQWFVATQFNHGLAVSAVGVFAGNAGSNPAHTAVVDYFFNNAQPIVDDDSLLCAPTQHFTLTTFVVGNGAIAKDPDLPSYPCGEQLVLTALPASGEDFIDWTGDIATTVNPLVLSMDSDKVLTAQFEGVIGPPPPVIQQVTVLPDATTALISWETDKPTSGRVEYGISPNYELGSVASTVLATTHSVSLSDLAPAMVYYYGVTAEADDGQDASPVDGVFSTVASDPGSSGILSDDFDFPNLDLQAWEVVDPVGDGRIELVGAGTANAQLRLGVPSGSNHDVWTAGNRSLRIMQAAQDEDFEIEVKFDSVPTQKYQLQGMLVEQDTADFIRFDYYSNGNGLFVFGAHFAPGAAPQILVNQAIANSADALYLRLSRSGDEWTAQYGYDGEQWFVAAQFDQPLTVSAVGVFAGNAGSNPAHTAVVDYFFNNAAPIFAEDDGIVDVDDVAPLIHQIRPIAGVDDVQLNWYTDEPTTATVEYGETAALEMGAISIVDLHSSHSLTIGGLLSNSVYFFRIRSVDIDGNASVAPILSVVTQDSGGAPPGDGPTIDVWYGPIQSFGQAGIPQRFANILGNVSDTDGVASLTYSLNDGPQQVLSQGPGHIRLARAGDFNAEIPYTDLQVGVNQVSLRAVDNLGNASVASVTVNYIDGPVPPQTYEIDWSTVSAISDVAQVVDGKWVLEGQGVRTVETGYDRLIALGDLQWTNYEATVEVTLNSVPSENGVPLLGFAMRWTGHYDWTGEQPRVGWWPLGAIGCLRWGFGTSGTAFQIIGSGGSVNGTNYDAPELAAGVPYLLKMRGELELDGELRYSFKVWPQGQPEPDIWGITWKTNQYVSPPASGSLLLLAHYIDVTFGRVWVVPLDN